jgi:hypothetical protein
MAAERKIEWARRVRPALIRRLYTQDARGIRDEELIDEVGYALLARCETIRRVTLRLCAFCGGKLSGGPPAETPIRCAGCGWRSTWGRYRRSYKGKRIHGGRAYPAFTRFLAAFPAARTPEEKMIQIDRLVHAVHEAAGLVWATPAACNLIEAKRDEVLCLLNDLAVGAVSTPGVTDRHEQWRQITEQSEKATRAFFEARGRSPGDRPILTVWRDREAEGE